MKCGSWLRRRRIASAMCTGGLVFQLGGCDIGEITTISTVDGRVALVSLLRGIILSPLDSFITQAVNDALAGNDN